jgi:GAF domain-containing protein
MVREATLVHTFVELADSLVDEFDLVELLTLVADRCVDVLDVAAAGLMVGAPDGELRVVGSSSDAMRVLELFEVQADEGPCPECYRTGAPIINEQLTTVDHRWPAFAPRALAAGFRSVHALPMRLRGRTIGALNLFRATEGTLGRADVAAAQAFADVATIAIVSHQSAAEAQAVNDQLTKALNSRIVIEQAKGMVAQQTGLDMEQSFHRYRHHARNHNLLLAEVAAAIIDGSLSPSDLDAVPPSRARSIAVPPPS